MSPPWGAGLQGVFSATQRGERGSTVCQWGWGRGEAGQGEGLLLLMEGLGLCSEELQSPTETPTGSLAHSLTLEE